ncbi:unnamed protein product (macronuclear) [Paramecium tetraurelia]|uniref:EF-hand domain-containing protein n=1 Tax=Paramecium tetraurelia TaxID=5888 RepID=A0DRK5_PARTE|nr:uncharacterized protein GSPATT00019390001 [Paramecium tetraurelia]CAK85672.1 unnamed protein product [Paramecium tetraurelia]|eukprot:XP_001453069.1 hypothetical protein (macronuclear) [Paramecium tetraurelia strain d4-2]
MYSIKTEPQPIAIVSLQMNDTDEEIRVYEGEDVENIVRLFCQQHQLGQDCVLYLVDQINQQLQREPSPRFGDSFGNKNISHQLLYPCHTQQSDIGITTQDSSVNENQNSAQKSYEIWQKIINQKTDLRQLSSVTQNTLLWNIPSSARSYNDNKKVTTNERLYRDGLDRQKTKLEQAEQYKLQKSILEQKESTFQPLISPRSRQMAEQKKLSRPDCSINNIGFQLYQKGLDMNSKKEIHRMQMQEQERKQSPFQPRITDTSRNNSQNRSNTPIHEKLYCQAKEDKKKKEDFQNREFSKIHPFHPNSSKNQIKQSTIQQKKFVDKLFKEQEEKQKRIEKKKQEFQIQTQSHVTFKPTINKDATYKKVSEKKENEDIKIALDLQKMQSRLQSKNSFSQSETRISSQQSLQSLLDLKIQRIFNKLDSDKDGYISKDNLSLEELDCETKKIIEVVLNQIEEDSYTEINLKGFKKLCEMHHLQEQLNSL